MPSPTSNQPFELLIVYLQGKINARQLHDAFIKDTQTQDAFAIYKDTSFSPEQKTQLQEELAVPEAATINDASNLLDLIDNLNKAGYGYGQLADFRYQLKKIKPETDWTGTLYFTTLVTGIVSSFFFVNDHHRDRLEAFLLRLAPFIAPLIAPFLLVGFQFYTIYQQATAYNEDTYHSDNHRKRRWFVGTFPALLNLSAYLAIAIIGSISPFSAGLFIGASLVAVVDGAFRFYHPQAPEELAAPGSASAIRQENRKKRTGDTLNVKIYAAVALSVTVVISCIFPPSIFVVLAYSALFILIPWTKNSFLNKIHTESSEQLQKDLYFYHGFTEDNMDQVTQLQTQVHNLETELEHQKNRQSTVTYDSAPPSRVGLFKPAMLDFSDPSSTELEASFWSPHL